MPLFDPKRITADALLLVFAGLSGSACDKTSSRATPEKSASPLATARPSPSSAVDAKEVEPPAPSGSAQMACAPGGCAPGKCGGAKE